MTEINPMRIDANRLQVLGSQNMHDVLTLYLQSADICFARLERAGAENNDELWAETLNAMQEAATAVTAMRLASICRECAAVEASKAQTHLYALQKELLLLRGEINHILTQE